MASIIRRFFNVLLIAALIAGALANVSPGHVFAQEISLSKSPAQEIAPKPAPPFAPDQVFGVSQANAATPGVSLSGLGDVLIGENFTFSISFTNNGSSPGYGPFIDLVFPTNGADGDANRATQDGIEFVNASILGYTFDATQDTLAVQTFPNPAGGVTCVDHPWAKKQDGSHMQVCGPAGDTLVSLRLPFGGVVPGQPVPTITVNAKLSRLADLGVPLNIRARRVFVWQRLFRQLVLR